MSFFKRKIEALDDELAQKLAIAFCMGTRELLSNRTAYDWLWGALPEVDENSVVREWAFVQMFLLSQSLRKHSQDVEAAEEFLDSFHNFALQILTENGLFESKESVGELLLERYRNYYQMMDGDAELETKLMKVAEKFFIYCGGTVDMEAVLAVMTCFLHGLIADKNLIKRLKRAQS